MGFGLEIKRLRKAHNVSAQLLADAIGIDAERLRSWEKQDLNPRADDRGLIEKYFGMSLEELMHLNKLPKVPNKSELPEAKKKGYPQHEEKMSLVHEPDYPTRSKMSIEQLVESNRALSEANRALAEGNKLIAKDNHELLQLYKQSLVGESGKSSEAALAKSMDVLALIAEIGVGKLGWNSVDEGIAFLSTKLYAVQQKEQSVGIPQHSGK